MIWFYRYIIESVVWAFIAANVGLSIGGISGAIFGMAIIVFHVYMWGQG